VHDDDYDDVVCAYVYKTRGGDGCEETHNIIINLHTHTIALNYYFIIDIININMIKYYVFTIPVAHESDENNIFSYFITHNIVVIRPIARRI